MVSVLEDVPSTMTYDVVRNPLALRKARHGSNPETSSKTPEEDEPALLRSSVHRNLVQLLFEFVDSHLILLSTRLVEFRVNAANQLVAFVLCQRLHV